MLFMHPQYAQGLVEGLLQAWPGSAEAMPYFAFAATSLAIMSAFNAGVEIDVPQPSDTITSALEKKYLRLQTGSHAQILLMGSITMVIITCMLNHGNSPFSFGPNLIITILTVIAPFAIAYTISCRTESVRLRNRTIRVLLASGTVLFRLGRIFDVAAAPDQVAFTLEAASNLRQGPYDIVTTWISFVQGMVVGHVQPTGNASSVETLAFILVVSGSSVAPAAVAYLLCGVSEWLVAAMRVVLLPSMVGLLVETAQRRFFGLALAHSVRNEQAIALCVPASLASQGGSAAKSAEPTVADYEPVGVLGFGGSGQVRLVRNRSGELVALKTIFKTRNGRALTKEQSRRVREERAILMAVHDHPFIVKLYNAIEDASCFHFELQLAPHGALSLWLMNPLSKRVARLVAAELTCALAHLHSHQVIYRDLKPENVLIGAAGHILLADFGVSKRMEEAVGFEAPNVSLVGTPGYIAPEVILCGYAKEGSYSYPVDWWALGVMLVVLVTTGEPLSTSTLASLTQKEDGGRSAEFLISERILQRLPEEGWDDVHDLACALLSIDPSARLGTAGGAEQVKAHPFFACIDWERLAQCKLPPPMPELSAGFGVDLDDETSRESGNAPAT